MTTNLNRVEGNNIFCGPGAISTVTGITTDQAERMIQKNRGRYTPVKAAYNHELYKVMTQLGWKVETLRAEGTLYNFCMMMTRDGHYMITLPGHFVVVLKEGNNRFFCDNQTKEPINAGVSSRLMQRVVDAVIVTKIAEVVAPPAEKIIQPSPYIPPKVNKQITFPAEMTAAVIAVIRYGMLGIAECGDELPDEVRFKLTEQCDRLEEEIKK